MTTHDRYYQLGSKDKLFNQIDELTDALASRDAEIAELKVVSDHNLHIYQEAASKMRAEIAASRAAHHDCASQLRIAIYERDKLREQVKMLNGVLKDHGIRLFVPLIEALAATEPKP